jgi:ComF family protein
MTLPRTYLADFVALLFPELCHACGQSLVAGESVICTGCYYNLPFTNFHLQADNVVARQFWGKINLEAAYAMCYFTKGGSIQNLMHHFKYKGIREIGYILGALAGEQLSLNPVFATADLIIPVPLHSSRLRKRGYNQSACIAEGIARKMAAVVEDNNLVRTRATETQTHRNRFSRFENMREVFALTHPESLAGKHLLLVDDILTTGSTLEACADVLLKVEGVRLSIATLAYTE